MHGQNTVAGPRPPGDYLVKDIWYTIQGEGPWSGFPAIFIRFSDCNQRCWFCDTDFTGGTNYNLAELVLKIEQMHLDNNYCRRIVMTGGEPMLQDLTPLIKLLCLSAHMLVQIETAGTVWPDQFSDIPWNMVTLVVSPKTPKVHPSIAVTANAWKYIIREGGVDLSDGLPNWSTQKPNERQKLFRPSPLRRDIIFVQPCDEEDELRNDANLQATAEIALKFGYRVSLQVHKLLGVE